MDRSLGQLVAKLPVAEQSPSPPKKTSRIWPGVKLGFLAVVLLILAGAGYTYLGNNFHSVIPGKCYRSAQPSERFLAELQRTHGIRSILNLRDENNDQPWYQEEKKAAERLGIKLVNVGLSSSEQPPDFEFRRFVEGMDACEQPMLIHCASGNDRSGLASAIYLMLYTKTPMAEARTQLSLRYGHIPWGKAACLQRILDSYETWLHEKGFEHRADHFRFWAKNEYQQEELE
jgi:protein tyrosine phosphatase (PTP) superfamily phosphohydrolase (DUF442 family)